MQNLYCFTGLIILEPIAGFIGNDYLIEGFRDFG